MRLSYSNLSFLQGRWCSSIYISHLILSSVNNRVTNCQSNWKASPFMWVSPATTLHRAMLYQQLRNLNSAIFNKYTILQSCPPEGFANLSKYSSEIPISFSVNRKLQLPEQATSSWQRSEDFLSYLKFAWVGSWECDELLSPIPVLSLRHLFGRVC